MIAPEALNSFAYWVKLRTHFWCCFAWRCPPILSPINF